MGCGEGLDIAGIRAEVQAAFKDPTGEQLSALRVKYPFLGTQASKNLAAMAMGGRIGFKTGLLVPEDEMTEKTNQMILQMHNRGADIDTISTITEKDAAYINSIISSQNQKAEGGEMLTTATDGGEKIIKEKAPLNLSLIHISEPTRPY